MPAAVSETESLLRSLAAGEEPALRAALVLLPGDRDVLGGQALERRTRALVRLAALVSLDAAVPSLRWAVELVCTAGAGEEAVVGALISAAPAAGSAQIVTSAQRLVLALECDADVEAPAKT